MVKKKQDKRSVIALLSAKICPKVLTASMVGLLFRTLFCIGKVIIYLLSWFFIILYHLLDFKIISDRFWIFFFFFLRKFSLSPPLSEAPFIRRGWCLRPRLYWRHTPIKGFFSHVVGEDVHWKQLHLCMGAGAWPSKCAPVLHFARTRARTRARAMWKAPLETIAISLQGPAPCEKNPFTWVCPQYKCGWGHHPHRVKGV